MEVDGWSVFDDATLPLGLTQMEYIALSWKREHIGPRVRGNARPCGGRVSRRAGG